MNDFREIKKECHCILIQSAFIIPYNSEQLQITALRTSGTEMIQAPFSVSASCVLLDSHITTHALLKSFFCRV
jgi:hypothetical protein